MGHSCEAVCQRERVHSRKRMAFWCSLLLVQDTAKCVMVSAVAAALGTNGQVLLLRERQLRKKEDSVFLILSRVFQ